MILWFSSKQRVLKNHQRKIILWAAVYDAVRKGTFTPIQDMKKECMTIINQKKVRLVNDETSMRNPDYSTVIYLTTAKVVQYRLVTDDKIEKEEAKKETAKKTATWKLHLQQKRGGDFRNTKTPWTVYHNLPPKNWCPSTSLTSLQQSSRMPLKTSEVKLVKFLIR